MLGFRVECNFGVEHFFSLYRDCKRNAMTNHWPGPESCSSIHRGAISSRLQSPGSKTQQLWTLKPPVTPKKTHTHTHKKKKKTEKVSYWPGKRLFGMVSCPVVRDRLQVAQKRIEASTKPDPFAFEAKGLPKSLNPRP